MTVLLPGKARTLAVAELDVQGWLAPPSPSTPPPPSPLSPPPREPPQAPPSIPPSAINVLLQNFWSGRLLVGLVFLAGVSAPCIVVRVLKKGCGKLACFQKPNPVQRLGDQELALPLESQADLADDRKTGCAHQEHMQEQRIQSMFLGRKGHHKVPTDPEIAPHHNFAAP